jgi:hypothetical protein
MMMASSRGADFLGRGNYVAATDRDLPLAEAKPELYWPMCENVYALHCSLAQFYACLFHSI